LRKRKKDFRKISFSLLCKGEKSFKEIANANEFENDRSQWSTNSRKNMIEYDRAAVGSPIYDIWVCDIWVCGI